MKRLAIAGLFRNSPPPGQEGMSAKVSSPYSIVIDFFNNDANVVDRFIFSKYSIKFI